MRFLDGAGSLATLHVQVELPPASVLIDLAIVTVASMVFGGAVGVVTFALEKLRPRAPRAVSLLLAALSLLAASFPFRLNRQIRPHFMVFFATASHGVVIFFKTIEVLCQTRPAGLERSLKPWVVYFACDAEMKFARPAAAAADVAAKAKQSAGPLPSPPLLRVFPRLFIRAIVFLAANSLLLHVGALYAWRPFRPRLGAVGAVLDVYFYACLLWSCAEWVIALARMAVHVCGYDSIPAFRLPLLQSASPREFWGKRWNLIIHKLMHRTYFEPVARSTGSPTLGALSAFIASALFHEYMWAVAVLPLAKEGMVFGEVSLFFCAQFALCSLELLASAALPKPVLARVAGLPRVVKVVCTALLICSFGEFFCENLLRAGMFASMQDLHPRVLVTLNGRQLTAG